MCFRPLAGIMLYSPPPSKRGRWRAVRAGGGACSGCDFLTLEMRGSFIAPLPPLRGPPPPLWQGRLGFARSVPLRGCGLKISSMKMLMALTSRACIVSVPLRGCGFKIRKTAQQSRCAFDVSVPLRGCGFEISSNGHSSHRWYVVSVPLRGCGFKMSMERKRKPFSVQTVSVPLRGCGFKMRLAAWLVRRLYCFRPLAGMWF